MTTTYKDVLLHHFQLEHAVKAIALERSNLRLARSSREEANCRRHVRRCEDRERRLAAACAAFRRRYAAVHLGAGVRQPWYRVVSAGNPVSPKKTAARAWEEWRRRNDVPPFSFVMERFLAEAGRRQARLIVGHRRKVVEQVEPSDGEPDLRATPKAAAWWVARPEDYVHGASPAQREAHRRAQERYWLYRYGGGDLALLDGGKSDEADDSEDRLENLNPSVIIGDRPFPTGEAETWRS